VASPSLSTHVLDAGRGEPARGVRIELYRDDELVAERTTDEDGRVGDLGEELEAGTYRLVFRPPSPFFRRVEVEVELGAGHYHVPLLVAPWSCTVYRGS
jgi:5-hydroxyisourate hydrolase